MNFQLRHCSIWSCLGLPCAAFPTRPRALHTLFFSTFYLTFRLLFTFTFYSFCSNFFNQTLRPAHSFLFFSTFLCHKNFLFACHFISITFPDIHHNCFKFTFFLSPACLHFDISLSKCIWAHKWWFTRFVATFFVLYLFLILYA